MDRRNLRKNGEVNEKVSQEDNGQSRGGHSYATCYNVCDRGQTAGQEVNSKLLMWSSGQGFLQDRSRGKDINGQDPAEGHTPLRNCSRRLALDS